MKDVYMIHMVLPEVFTPRFYDILSGQKDRINDLLEKRVLLSYSLDMDRKNIWAFIEAKSKKELREILSKIPIVEHVKIRVHELAFHNEAPVNLPDLIMN
jgi:hypothetical protein